MIAFGCPVTRPEAYQRWAAPGIARVREPDSVVYANSSAGSIFRAYNLLLEQAQAHEDLEALVLLHQDVEILEDSFCATVRAALGDDEVGVVGCAGALDARSMAWWEGAVTWGSFTHRYYEYGGGILPAFAAEPKQLAQTPYARTGEVDTVDGILMVLSPWAVRELRFDEALGRFHGYDFDFCMQVRRAGRKVVTADLKVVHHHSLELIGDPEAWIAAYIRVAEKWEAWLHQWRGQSDDWRVRALRAEAEAAAARTLRISGDMQARARERQLQRELDAIRQSTTWRLTGPARRLARRLRRG